MPGDTHSFIASFDTVLTKERLLFFGDSKRHTLAVISIQMQCKDLKRDELTKQQNENVKKKEKKKKYLLTSSCS